MDAISVKAFAKVNMLLEVKGERPDGYHEVETLYRGIRLHDDVVLSKCSAGIRLACEGLSIPGMLPDASNLAWRAAEMFRDACPSKVKGASIRLVKHIPAEAGLGGGSADAAAVLIGLNRLYDVGLGDDALYSIAAQLGSDVPFCLAPLAAVGRGRGEVVEHVAPMALGPALWIVLVKPPFGLSTKAVYSRWKPRSGASAVAGTGAGAAAATADKRMDRLLHGMREWQPELILENMHNDLEEPACATEPRLKAYREWIEDELAALAEQEAVRRGAVGTAGWIGSADGTGAAEATGVEGMIWSAGTAGLTCAKILLCGSGSAFAVYFIEETLVRLLAERLITGRDQMKEQSHMWRDGANPASQADPQIWVTRTLAAEDMAGRVEEV
jgi:4-diphosphocytidyl-2-C-methyl-D-erythritol kinase